MNEDLTDPAAASGNLHPLEIRELLGFAKKPGKDLSDAELTELAGASEAQHRRAVELLMSRALAEKTREQVEEYVSLSEAGVAYAALGLPESRLIARLRETGGAPLSELKALPGLDQEESGTAVGFLKKNGAIDVAAGVATVVEDKAAPFDELQSLCASLSGGVEKSMSSLPPPIAEMVRAKARRRGKDRGAFNVSTRTLRWYRLTKTGADTAEELGKSGATGEEITALTPAMLRDGSWKGKAFRRYNLEISPPRVNVGRKHPYRAYLDFVKTKLLAMGFNEMSGSLVETEFWNMDALFMPQFHASREIHDIYQIREPSHAAAIPSPFIENVAATHSNGWKTGSRGWGYEFDSYRTRRHVLRSQGTVLSVRTLSSKPMVPGKYFAMARCFRPDRVDATHAVDFYQVEGIVIGEDVTFRKLLGLLKMFALEIARSDRLKFVPSYFPFTEPSVEVHMMHPKVGWTELGGAGIFRREVTDPMGVTVPVAAWGLGLDRMAMVALGIDDIRDLFSRDLNKIRETKARIRAVMG